MPPDPPSPLFDLSGRQALVTGSSQGIGLALAAGLGRAGARVILNGRDPAKLARAAATLAAGPGVAVAAFDVTDRAAVTAAVAAIETERGPIDILINNAGIQRRMSLEDFPEATWDELIRTNLTSAFLVSQAVARRMIARGRGRIVNICSVQSELARPTIAPYAASKGALKMLTRGMCADWARHGLQINGIAPGYFATDLNRALMEDETFSAWVCTRTPAARWGKVEELVGAAVFLCSDAASYVNGHILTVDGGLSATV